FLGLRTLTVIRDALDLINRNKDNQIIIDQIDFEDKDVYNMISSGKTVGVFQLESTGMTSFMKSLKPNCMEDVIAGIALYRPGPMDFIPKYIQGKYNPDCITYDTKE